MDGIRKEIHARVRPELLAQDARTADVRHAVIPGVPPALVAWRRLGQDTSVPAVFGFHLRLDYFGGPLLAQVLETVDLGGELHVALTAPENAPTVRADGSSSSALVEVELLPSLRTGRSRSSTSRGDPSRSWLRASGGPMAHWSRACWR